MVRIHHLLLAWACLGGLALTAQAAETRGKAIVAFQVMILNLNPGNAKLAATLEKAWMRQVAANCR